MNSSGQAKAGEASIWQIVFHQPEKKKALLVSDAWSAGCGLNITDTRVLLRIPYTAGQIQLVEVGMLILSQQDARLCRSNQILSYRIMELTFLQ